MNGPYFEAVNVGSPAHDEYVPGELRGLPAAPVGQPWRRFDAPEATMAPEQRRIPAELDNLDRAVGQLTDVLTVLSEKLEPVLHHDVPPAPTPTGPPRLESPSVPLADSLDAFANRVRIQADRVERLLLRLEL